MKNICKLLIIYINYHEKNRTIKKQALCEELNMNLDEDNELFETETLESMQMAMIAGGTPVIGAWNTVSKIIEWLGGIDTFTSIWEKIAGNDEPTPNPESSMKITYDPSGSVSTIEVKGSADPIIISVIKIYGLGASDSTPTPTPNSNIT